MSTEERTMPRPEATFSELVRGIDVEERRAPAINGGIGLLVVLACFGAGALTILPDPTTRNPAPLIALVIVGSLLASGLTIVSPGDTKVVQFFGRYVGTIRRTGLVMTVPLTTTKKVSVKVHNFETSELKVNDADGNPVNIAAIVVWQVSDTAKAVFAVEDAHEFVAVQSESALRHIAGAHPYDNAAPGQETLRGSTESIAAELAAEVAARITIAGLTVIETRISSLAYAPEIAQAMLQRQQAAMVSNLLVVLCSDSRATPVVNTGTLYA